MWRRGYVNAPIACTNIVLLVLPRCLDNPAASAFTEFIGGDNGKTKGKARGLRRKIEWHQEKKRPLHPSP
jgi:hypothetical protein